MTFIKTTTAEDDDTIRQEYPTNGCKAVAAKLGISVSACRNRAWRLGVRSEVGPKLTAVVNSTRPGRVRYDFFDTWTAGSAYVLGYIWADGCVMEEGGKPARLGFTCTASDADHLRKLAAALGSTARPRPHPARDWTAADGTPRHSKASVSLDIWSTELAGRLVSRHGVLPRKSLLDLPYPEDIPDDMLSHFARGNLDGDGTVCLMRARRRAYIALLGSPKFVTGLAAAVSRVAGVTPAVVCPHGTCLLRATWTARADVLRLREWLYTGATVWLDRKRRKFDQVAEVLASVKQYRQRTRKGGVVVFTPPPAVSEVGTRGSSAR